MAIPPWFPMLQSKIQVESFRSSVLTIPDDFFQHRRNFGLVPFCRRVDKHEAYKTLILRVGESKSILGEKKRV